MGETQKFDIKTLSNLARINLSKEEEANLSNDLSKIITYVEKLDEIDTGHLEPTSHVLNIENVFREDEVINQATAVKVIDVLPETSKEGDFFRVPKVIEES